MTDFRTNDESRRLALRDARACPTCRDGGHEMGHTTSCIGCQASIDYWSCCPGYCIACAHNPAWVPVSLVLSPAEKQALQAGEPVA